jgi:transcriptional regulator of acetoin/glycerol metabolism
VAHDEGATVGDQALPGFVRPSNAAAIPALVITWSVDAPDRVGEVALLRGSQPVILGREHDEANVLGFGPQRPGDRSQPTALRSPRLSRRQLEIRATSAGGIELRNLGRAPLIHNGTEAENATAQAGDVVQIGNTLQLLVVPRPGRLLLHHITSARHDIGQPDADGLVGESPSAWRLRDRIRFVSEQRAHVLIHGPSGSGKELVARAIHRHSHRRRKPMVARNAATLPDGLIDAELFGNCRNYPNPGTPDRSGLVGEADGSVLFLDEVGELSEPMQARLLRLLDEGEYQRLGESTMRRSDLRFVGATNRDLVHLKHDFQARMAIKVQVPGLSRRRDDIPFLVRHLLRGIAANASGVRDRFFEGDHPRLVPALMRRLVQHPYTTNTRELEQMLWIAVSESPGNYLELCPGHATETTQRAVEIDPADLPPEAIQEALDRHEGRQEAVWRELGLRNRHVLARLIRKHGLAVKR